MTSSPRFLTAAIPPVRASFRESPEDFEVEEVPLYAASGAGDHTYILIEKRGLATRDALREIARRLGRRPDDIGYAGLKDARAVTRQWISIEGLAEAAYRFIDDGGGRVRAVAFARHTNKLKPGHLRGNRFRIRLRGAGAAGEDAARRALDLLAREGIPNRFGRQRFGGARGTTHALGLALLRGEWGALVALLCGRPDPAENARVREARARFDAGLLREAHDLFPARMRAERAAIRVLLKGRDPASAVAAIPKEDRRLYANAAQSSLFNELLDERMDLGLLGTLERGDVAFIHGKGASFVVEDAAREEPRARAFEISPAGPLFGTKLLRATGEPGAREERVLAAHGFALESFRAPLAGNLKGARRPYRIPLEEARLEREGDAIVLSFFLPAGAYATAVVGELLKREVG